MHKYLLIYILTLIDFSQNICAQELGIKKSSDLSQVFTLGLKVKPNILTNGLGFDTAGTQNVDFPTSIKYNELDSSESFLVKKPHTDIGGCSQQGQESSNPGFGLAPVILASKAVTSKLSCNLADTQTRDRLNGPNCVYLVNCIKSKINDKNFPEEIYQVNIPKYVAEDFVVIKFDTNIEEMEKVEQVRLFAESKYGKAMTSKCKSPFNYDSSNESNKKSCDISLLNDGFNNLQKDCTRRQSCYNSNLTKGLKYSKFLENYKADKPIDSQAQAYFDAKISLNVTDSLMEDSELVASIGTLTSSNDSDEKKVDTIFLKLKEYFQQGKLDPVIGSDKIFFESTVAPSSASIHYDSIKKLVKNSHSIESAKKAFEDYRKGLAKSILNKSCPVVETITDICADATKISKNKKVSQYNLSKKSNLKVLPADDKEISLERFEKIKKSFLNFGSYDDFNIFMDSERCRTLGYVDPYPWEGYNLHLPTHNLSLAQSTISHYFSINESNVGGRDSYLSPEITALGDSAIPTTRANRSLGTSGDVLAPTQLSIPSSSSLVAAISSTNASTALGSENSSSTTDFSKKLSGEKSAIHSMAKDPTQSIDSFGNFNNINEDNKMFQSNSLHSLDSGEKNLSRGELAERAIIGDSGSNEKINELQKKLAASEGSIEKMKAEKEASEAERVRQKKSDEDEKIIADLKNQVNTLNDKILQKDQGSQSGLSPSLSNSNNAREVGNLSSNKSINVENVNSSDMSNSSQPTSSIEIGQQGQKEFSSISSSAGVGVNSPFNTGAQGQSKSSMSSSLANGSLANMGIILSKMDGLSEEKVAETIGNKIQELQGQPFLIEEGGVIKQVVPEIKNGKVVLDEKGKPIFTKITKGKVGDSKYAKLIQDNKSNRSPAQVESSADLKRDEEERLKKERAEYLKLKKLTSEAVDFQ